MIAYEDFLERKRIEDVPTGISEIGDLHPQLFPFQRDIVEWSLRRGRCAEFADCGLGKTIMQLVWADHVPGKVLILAPLAVSSQTIQEGVKFDIEVKSCRRQSDATSKINITNYEMLEHFDPSQFNAIVLDESSILKSYTGKYRTLITESFAQTPFRLACTATPAPNDFMELGNHSEFLGIMNRTEMLSMFFVHDGGETQKWRLKGHAKEPFWRWICSWAVNIRKPSDLGYDDGKFTLPEIIMHQHHVKKSKSSEGFLFPVEALTLQDRQYERKETTIERCEKAASLVTNDRPWLLWCNLNNESTTLKGMIPGSVEVKGSDHPDKKREALLGFANGDIRVLVTKPSIAGFGMNWQHCADMVFVGLSDSYEQFYQAVRRCWRFGQENQVNVHVVTAETEGAVVRNIQRKERDSDLMSNEMVKFMAGITSKEIHATSRNLSNYCANEKIIIPKWCKEEVHECN